MVVVKRYYNKWVIIIYVIIYLTRISNNDNISKLYWKILLYVFFETKDLNTNTIIRITIWIQT